MKSKKVTMLVAALVVAVVALAGVGYATATQYKGTTENTNNTMDVTWIRLSQDGTAAYTNSVSFIDGEYFNTTTTSTGTTYTVTGTTAPTGTSAPTGAFVISNENLHLIFTDNVASATTYTFRVTTAANLYTDTTSATNTLSYYIGLKNTDTDAIVWSGAGVIGDGTSTTGGTTWEIANVAAAGADYIVMMAASGSVFVETANIDTDSPDDLRTVSFTFAAISQ